MMDCRESGSDSPLAAHRYIRGSAREGAQETSKDTALAHDLQGLAEIAIASIWLPAFGRPDDAPAYIPVLGWPSTE